MVMASLPLPPSSLVELNIYPFVTVMRIHRVLMGTIVFLCIFLVIEWSMVMGVSHVGRGVVVGVSMWRYPVPFSVMMLLRTSVQWGS